MPTADRSRLRRVRDGGSARAAEREIAAGKYRGRLHGVPIAVKDLCYTKGVRTMGGTAVRKDFVPDVDATVVSKLRDAGAVLLGNLNLSEGATAAGLCYAAIGTDMGGSIRNPSSANGVVGLKPTYGRVSRYGVLAMAESIDHVGPMAPTVREEPSRGLPSPRVRLARTQRRRRRRTMLHLP
jgi:amidase